MQQHAVLVLRDSRSRIVHEKRNGMRRRLGLLLLLLALLAEAPILGALIAGFVITGLLYAATRAGRATINYIRESPVVPLLRQYLGFGNRWRVLVPVILVAMASFVASLFLWGDKGGGGFLHDQAAFFGTAAQVLAALLVTMALSQTAGSDTEVRVVRPVLGLAVVAAGVGELAAVVALSLNPSLPSSLQALVFSLTISAGSTALLSVILVGLRFLGQTG